MNEKKCGNCSYIVIILMISLIKFFLSRQLLFKLVQGIFQYRFFLKCVEGKIQHICTEWLGCPKEAEHIQSGPQGILKLEC